MQQCVIGPFQELYGSYRDGPPPPPLPHHGREGDNLVLKTELTIDKFVLVCHTNPLSPFK